MKVMCYVQHLMGTGHQWRVAAISRALRELGVDVIYVSGGLPIPGLDPGCETFVQLPAVRADDMHYQTLVDEEGWPVDDGWKSRRRNVLLTAFARCQPDVLLIETFPFGRGLLRFELLPLLEAAYERRPRPRVVCSVRDVLEAKRRPGRNEEIVDLVDRYFDLVLVHSDPKFVLFDTTFPLAHQIEHKLRYTGYVKARDAPKPTSDLGSGEVIVSAGGGAFGEHVLRTAIEARPLSVLAKAPWRILVGPNLSPQRFANLLPAHARSSCPMQTNENKNKPCAHVCWHRMV
jgi:predicted glycosyltransferase